MTWESINARQGLLDLRAPVHFAVHKNVSERTAWVCLFQQHHAFGLEGVSHDVAAILVAKGRVGQVVGDMRDPRSVRLVVSHDAATPLDVAIHRQILAPCAAAFGRSAPPLKFMDPLFPVAGTKLSVQIGGERLDGVVTGHGTKDGRTTLDIESEVVFSDGRTAMRNLWAWPEQVVDVRGAEAMPVVVGTNRPKEPLPTGLEFTCEQLERIRAQGSVTRSGVVYHEELAGPGGMSFVLLREPETTEEMLAVAVKQLRTDRDVVGQIKVTAVIQAEVERQRPRAG